jgi:hypothetical protein
MGKKSDNRHDLFYLFYFLLSPRLRENDHCMSSPVPMLKYSTTLLVLHSSALTAGKTHVVHAECTAAALSVFGRRSSRWLAACKVLFLLLTAAAAAACASAVQS